MQVGAGPLRRESTQHLTEIIKPVEKYIDSAKTERNIVKALNEADQEGTVPIVRYRESFYHYQYYCLVF